MHLKSITLKGFKSFPDRTRLDFDPGVSVIVGPNGSGKSNVTDAVLWAMGEQSPLAVRGQSMQDVIFGGGRGVQARLGGRGRDRPRQRRRGASTCRSARSRSCGGSTAPATASTGSTAPAAASSDVLEVLSDTGLGKEMHSVVSQGRVEAIVTSKPKDRRLLIEEAAGLGKHRKRRRRAQLKLERTQDNLDRALDVEREARSRLRPLKRQAEAAELHERLERQTAEARWELAREAVRARRADLATAAAAARSAREARDAAQAELGVVAARRQAAEEALAQRTEQRRGAGPARLPRRGPPWTASRAAWSARARRRPPWPSASSTARPSSPSCGPRPPRTSPTTAAAPRAEALEAELARLDADRAAALEREVAELEERARRRRCARHRPRGRGRDAPGGARRGRGAPPRRPAARAAGPSSAPRPPAARPRAWAPSSRGPTSSCAATRASSPATPDRRGQSVAGRRAAGAGRLRARAGRGARRAPQRRRGRGPAGGRAGCWTAPAATAAARSSPHPARPPRAPGDTGGPPTDDAVAARRARARRRARAGRSPGALLAEAWVVDDLAGVPTGFAGTAVTRDGRAWSPATRELRQEAQGGAERVLAVRNERDELIVPPRPRSGPSARRSARSRTLRAAVAAADTACDEAATAARDAARARRGGP